VSLNRAALVPFLKEQVMSIGSVTPAASNLDEYDTYAAADTPRRATASADETSSSRLASASLQPDGSSPSNVGDSQGTLVAGRTFPRDAFVDTTRQHTWDVGPVQILNGGYTFSREAQLRNERNGVSVAADVKVTRSSDGRTLQVNTSASYQDTTGKPIAKVYVEELPLVDGKKPTGQSWTFGGTASTGGSTGGGITLGGGSSDINTTSGTPSRRNLSLANNNGGGSYAIPIDANSRELVYKFSVTVVYKDGTSSGPVQVSAPSPVK
jgi:hypothetical protein